VWQQATSQALGILLVLYQLEAATAAGAGAAAAAATSGSGSDVLAPLPASCLGGYLNSNATTISNNMLTGVAGAGVATAAPSASTTTPAVAPITTPTTAAAAAAAATTSTLPPTSNNFRSNIPRLIPSMQFVNASSLASVAASDTEATAAATAAGDNIVPPASSSSIIPTMISSSNNSMPYAVPASAVAAATGTSVSHIEALRARRTNASRHQALYNIYAEIDLTNEQETSVVGAGASTGVAAALNDMARPSQQQQQQQQQQLFPSVQSPTPASVLTARQIVISDGERPRPRPEMVDLYELQVNEQRQNAVARRNNNVNVNMNVNMNANSSRTAGAGAVRGNRELPAQLQRLSHVMSVRNERWRETLDRVSNAILNLPLSPLNLDLPESQPEQEQPQQQDEEEELEQEQEQLQQQLSEQQQDTAIDTQPVAATATATLSELTAQYLADEQQQPQQQQQDESHEMQETSSGNNEVAVVTTTDNNDNATTLPVATLETNVVTASSSTEEAAAAAAATAVAVPPAAADVVPDVVAVAPNVVELEAATESESLEVTAERERGSDTDDVATVVAATGEPEATAAATVAAAAAEATGEAAGGGATTASAVVTDMSPEVRAALGDLEVPEGVDPSFLAALPSEMREEVIQEHLRMQRIRQRAQQNAIQIAHDSLVEVNPEFLAALPPNIQSEVLMQQRIEQQRQAAQSANPDDPVDTAAFFQNLPENLRQAVSKQNKINISTE